MLFSLPWHNGVLQSRVPCYHATPCHVIIYCNAIMTCYPIVLSWHVITSGYHILFSCLAFIFYHHGHAMILFYVILFLSCRVIHLMYKACAFARLLAANHGDIPHTSHPLPHPHTPIPQPHPPSLIPPPPPSPPLIMQ